MRTRHFFAVLLFLALSLSCIHEYQEVSVDKPSEYLEVTAFWGSEYGHPSRTVVDPNDSSRVLWAPYDEIALVYRGEYYGKFTSSNTKPDSITKFTGVIPHLVGALESGPGDSNYMAAYPYDSFKAFSDSSLTLIHHPEQIPVAGTFACNSFLSVARSQVPAMAFYNVCGGARFSVTEEGVTRVVFKSVDSTALAGTVEVGFDEFNKPRIIKVSEPVDSVIIVAPDEDGFVPGQNYYAVMLPGRHSKGMEIRLSAQRKRAIVSLGMDITVKRSCFGSLFKIDDGVKYDTIIPPFISFVDSVARRICVANFDTDGDGEVDFEEAAAVKSFETCFRNNTELEYFPEISYFTGVTRFDDTFLGCSALMELIIPDNIHYVGNSAFESCTNLQSLEFPVSLDTLGARAFANCSSLLEAELSNCTRLSVIPALAFESCTNLQTVTFPPSLERIGASSFAGCVTLNSADFEDCDSLTEISDGAFASCTKLKTVKFPPSLTSIGASAFASCSSLGPVLIDKCQSLSVIGKSAFSGCSGAPTYDITIPESVLLIGSGALTPFKYVNILCNVPPAVSNDTFNENVRIGVPAESLSDYKSANTSSPWYQHEAWIYPLDTFEYPPCVEVVSDTLKRLHLFGITADFILMQPGSYKNARKELVTLTEPYYLAQTELTREMWVAVTKKDINSFTTSLPEAIQCPITGFSWTQLETFLNSLNSLVLSETFRVPTEAEWEYAARDRDTTYSYSGSNELSEVGWYFDNCTVSYNVNGAKKRQPHVVKTKNPNNRGFYDMSGNVSEFVIDYYSSGYMPSGVNPVMDVYSDSRVVRGGYFGAESKDCKVSSRTFRNLTQAPATHLGVRLALMID